MSNSRLHRSLRARARLLSRWAWYRRHGNVYVRRGFSWWSSWFAPGEEGGEGGEHLVEVGHGFSPYLATHAGHTHEGISPRTAMKRHPSRRRAAPSMDSCSSSEASFQRANTSSDNQN